MSFSILQKTVKVDVEGVDKRPLADFDVAVNNGVATISFAMQSGQGSDQLLKALFEGAEARLVVDKRDHSDPTKFTNGELIEMLNNAQGGYQAASESADNFREGLCAALGLIDENGRSWSPGDNELIRIITEKIQNNTKDN